MMKNSKPSRNKSNKQSISSKQLPDNERVIGSLEKEIKAWKNETKLLSYEEALNALDMILENLQNDLVPLEELQESHIKGSIYLDHCHKLLDSAEQKVLQLDPRGLEK